MGSVKSLAKVATPLVYKQKEQELFAAADKHNGNFQLIANETNLTVNQIQRFYKDYPAFAEVVDNARDAFYNKALNVLEQLIEQGNMGALNLYFARSPWAKKNGWGEKVETDQKVKLSDAEKAQKAKEILGI